MATVTHRLRPYDGDPVEVTVTGLDRPAWWALLAQHPPRDGERGLWHEDTFAPALIEACTGTDLDTARERWDEWPADAAEDLYLACVRASAPTSVDWAVHALRRDDRLALEAGYCADKGIPHSTFAAWPVRDQDLILAAWTAARDTCPGCGAPSWAMRDPTAMAWKPVACVHCEDKPAVLKDIPEDQRHRIHLTLQHTDQPGGEG